jgi:hypothetical protein
MTDPTGQLRTYSVQELEQISRQALDRIGLDGLPPVDIEYLIETLPGVQLDYYPALKANHQILGMVCREVPSNRFLIFIDADLADSESQRARYRMTVAEEYAHLLIHRTAIETVQGIDGFRALLRFRKWYECERNAKKLAAMLLMPSAWIDRDSRALYSQLVRVAGFGNPDIIKKFLKNKLAERYEVSLQAMEIRLQEWPVKIYEKVEQAMKDGLDFLE